MHRKREAPAPAISAKSNDNSMAPISAASKSQDGDGALLALERQFEVLAREIAILLRTSATQDRKGKRDLGYEALRRDRATRAEEAAIWLELGTGQQGRPQNASRLLSPGWSRSSEQSWRRRLKLSWV